MVAKGQLRPIGVRDDLGIAALCEAAWGHVSNHTPDHGLNRPSPFLPPRREGRGGPTFKLGFQRARSASFNRWPDRVLLWQPLMAARVERRA
jgi:hypothetical protein